MHYQQLAMEALSHVELEVEEVVEMYPEKRLLAAVIFTLIEDYENCLKKLYGQTVAPVQLKWSLASMRREVESQYFITLCDYVGIDAYHIRNKLRFFDAKYPFNVTEWTTIECDLEYHERKERAANMSSSR